MNIFLNRYEQLLGSSARELVKAKVKKQSLRVNTLKIDPSLLISRLEKQGVKLKKIPYLDNGYIIIESKFSLGSTPEYLQGYYYLQESASQLPVTILNPLPNELILDMCAAPGGKTTQIAAMMQNTGTIIALDTANKRLSSLKNNLERLGVKNTIVYKKDARFARDLKLSFDKILLDAPCSGNFANDDNWFLSKTIDGIKERARLQKELLKEAIGVLKVNGILIYSTCSLEPEENELNINWLINKFKDKIRIEELNIDIGVPGITNIFGTELNPEVKKSRRFWPHLTHTQGFFICKIRKVKD